MVRQGRLNDRYHSIDVSRYVLQYTVKTVKHPDSVMVWGAFSGNKDRGGLHFLPMNVIMKGNNYIMF